MSQKKSTKFLKKELHVVEHELVSSAAMVLLLRAISQRFSELHGGFGRNLCCFQLVNLMNMISNCQYVFLPDDSFVLET